jgi:hypothetical protein
VSLRVQRRIATASVSQDGWPPSVQCSRADGGIAEVGQPPADAEGLQADGDGMKIRNSHAQGRAHRSRREIVTGLRPGILGGESQKCIHKMSWPSYDEAYRGPDGTALLESLCLRLQSLFHFPSPA